jgi:hypothetical protein
MEATIAAGHTSSLFSSFPIESSALTAPLFTFIHVLMISAPLSGKNTPHAVLGVSNIKQYIPESLDFSKFFIWQNLFTDILHCGFMIIVWIYGTHSHSQFITKTSGQLIVNLDFAIWQ